MHASEIISGFYTDEEMAAIDGEVAESPEAEHAETSGASKPLAAPVATAEAPAKTAASPAKEPADEKPAETTTAQRNRIKDLFVALEMTGEQQDKVMQKRGANALRNLTHASAADLLAALEAAYEKRLAKAAGESQMPADATTWPNSGPCSQSQVDAIKQALRARQDKPLNQRVGEHLARFGKAKINELTMADADALLTSLTNDNLAAFFAASLAKPEAAPASEGGGKN
jgi:hypothetical protein